MRADESSFRTRTTRTVAVTGALLSSLLLAGCSDASQPPSAEDAGPLAEYMSPLLMSEEAADGAARAEHERAQELTAECMSAAGFDYKPWPFTGGPITGNLVEGGSGSETDAAAEEFAETYGYGIVEDPDFDTANAAGGEQDPELVDINGKYINSLTESEQDAYWEALNGPPMSEEELQAELEDERTTVMKGRGCAGESADTARSEQADVMVAREDPEFQDLFEAERQLNEPLDPESPSNEDLIALNGLWNECMEKAGHSGFTSPMNAHNALGQEFDQLESDAGDLDEVVSKIEKDRFQTLEIEVASADLSCRKTVSYEAEVTRITHELEQTFVDEYKTELDALVVRYGMPAVK